MKVQVFTAVLVGLAMLAAPRDASALNVHVTGSDWGVWITGIFDLAANPDGSTQYSLTDGGSGNPMDFMMDLSDGTSIDGADVNMRMVSSTLVGEVGDAQMGLTDWSLWIGTDDLSLHVIWESAAAPLTLSNIGSSGKDGVRYVASGFDEQLLWTLERADGTVETFNTNFDSFEFVAPVPAPGAAALFGLAGLTASRRRRG